jgi:hypothetical protein
MPSSAVDFLTIAPLIQVLEPAEMGRRCAASRAYYAALHTADALFERPSVRADGKRESSHERIILAAKLYGQGANPGRSSAKQVAALLGTIKIDRNRADYDLDLDYTERQCSDMFMRVKEVLRLCAEITSKRLDSDPMAPIASASQAPQAIDVIDPEPPTPPASNPRPALRRVS